MYQHSVTLDEEKCKGCTNCIKRCPAEAIRVKKGRAQIIPERCIDCGECIRVCPYHAKKAVSDSLDIIQKFDWKIAIPAPALYGQFDESVSVNKILTSLKYLGFDEVFEVARAAEVMTEATRSYLQNNPAPRPIISSSCPVIVRLIQNRVPSLLENILPLISPMELSARIVKEKHKGKNVGVFFISPCAAKVTAMRAPRGIEKSSVDGVIGIKDIFLLLSNVLKKVEAVEELATASAVGISWARTEGEGAALGSRKIISVDGIRQVISILEEIEDGKLKDIDFIEMMSCPGGCVGGPMVMENPYIARTRIKNREFTKIHPAELIPPATAISDLHLSKPIKATSIYKLDEDINTAVSMMEKMEIIEQHLPGLDCGSCGAPTCRSLAEDVVRGLANETDCAFVLREKLRHLTEELMTLENMLPPGLDKVKEEEVNEKD